MFGFPQNYFIFLLLPTLLISILFYIDFIFLKKKKILYGINIWCLGTLMYYSMLILIIVYLNLPNYYLYSTSISSNCIILLYLLSVLQLYVYSLFFSKLRLLYIPLLITFVIFLPALFTVNFITFFICIESVMVVLGIIFIYKGIKNSYNYTLLSLIISNSITFLLFSISISAIYVYYGTTNLSTISVLFNYTFTDYLIIVILFTSVLCKFGQFPVFFYNIGIYNGLGIPHLGLYTIIYTNILYLPCIVVLKTIILFLFTSIPFLLITLIIILNLLTSYFNTNAKDFLFISTSLYTPLFFLI